MATTPSPSKEMWCHYGIDDGGGTPDEDEKERERERETVISMMGILLDATWWWYGDITFCDAMDGVMGRVRRLNVLRGNQIADHSLDEQLRGIRTPTARRCRPCSSEAPCHDGDSAHYHNGALLDHLLCVGRTQLTDTTYSNIYTLVFVHDPRVRGQSAAHLAWTSCWRVWHIWTAYDDVADDVGDDVNQLAPESGAQSTVGTEPTFEYTLFWWRGRVRSIRIRIIWGYVMSSMATRREMPRAIGHGLRLYPYIDSLAHHLKWSRFPLSHGGWLWRY